MRPHLPLAFAVLVNAFLLTQLPAAAPPDSAGAIRSAPNAPAAGGDIVQTRSIAAGERTILTVRTSGIVEVVIYEHMGDAALLAEFQAGRTPRTARVFTDIKEVAYPLASQAGSDFHVRVHHRVPGDTVLHYEVGTIEQAMTRLRKGSNLVRNRGAVRVDRGLHQMAVYQLVPGTIIKIELVAGRGTVGLLKTLDYLAVRDGKATLASRCVPRSCLGSDGGRNVLEFAVDDYDDRYLVATSEGEMVEFTYQVIATPEVLNYIATCT